MPLDGVVTLFTGRKLGALTLQKLTLDWRSLGEFRLS